jgi:hypothetical protein
VDRRVDPDARIAFYFIDHKRHRRGEGAFLYFFIAGESKAVD